MTAWARDTGSCSGSRLPYSLRFELVVTDLDRPTLLGGAASGELTGPAGGPWPPDGTGTLVTYDWKFSTTRWWMNLLGPIARPIFESNHDVVMDRGRTGLARHLGVHVARGR